MAKTNGRVISDATLRLYSEQVMACLQMWGLSQADAYYLARDMKYRVAKCKKEDWKNPLEGTGLTAPKLIDELAVAQGLAPTVPDNAISAPAMARQLQIAEAVQKVAS